MAIASGAIALDAAIASPDAVASGAMALEGAAIASAAMALEGAIASPAAIGSADIGGQAVDAMASAANTEVVADISKVRADAITIIEDFIGYLLDVDGWEVENCWRGRQSNALNAVHENPIQRDR